MPVDNRQARPSDEFVEPLLPTTVERLQAFPLSDAHLLVEEEEEVEHGCSKTAAILNLSNTIIGAGLMALPRVFAELGIVCALAIMSMVYLLSYYSLGAVVRAAEITKQNSYSMLVMVTFGKFWKTLLQIGILCNNGGMMIVYLSILGDTLADPDAGLLSHFIPGVGTTVWTSKPMVLLFLMIMLLLPLCCSSMELLGRASGVSIGTAYAFGGVLAGLMVTAAVQGKIHDVHWLPDPTTIGSTGWTVLRHVLITFPVTMTSYICHFQLLPLKKEIHDYSQRKLLDVINMSLAVTTVLYLVTALSGYCLFGSSTSENILKNLTADFLHDLVGKVLGGIIGVAVELGYAMVLALTYPLINWALRDTIRELFFTSELSSRGFYCLTVILQSLLLLCSVLLPSIFTVLGVMGATAGVLVAYFFPGLLILRVGPNVNKRRRVTAAVTMLTVGLILAIITVSQTVIS